MSSGSATTYCNTSVFTPVADFRRMDDLRLVIDTVYRSVANFPEEKTVSPAFFERLNIDCSQ